MLELKGLRGEELLEAYKANVLEFERITAPYGVREDWWVQSFKTVPYEGMLQIMELTDEKYVDLFEEKYAAYVWFFPRKKKSVLRVFLEGYREQVDAAHFLVTGGRMSQTVKEVTIEALEWWLEGRGG